MLEHLRGRFLNERNGAAVNLVDQLQDLVGEVPFPTALSQRVGRETPRLPSFVRNNMHILRLYAQGASLDEMIHDPEHTSTRHHVLLVLRKTANAVGAVSTGSLLSECFETGVLDPYSLVDFAQVRRNWTNLNAEQDELVTKLLGAFVDCKSTRASLLAERMGYSIPTVKRHIVQAATYLQLPPVARTRNLLTTVAYCAQQEGLLTPPNSSGRRTTTA